MDNKKPNNKPQMNMPRFNMNWIYGLVIIALITLYLTQGNEKSSVRTETTYSDFKTMVMKGYADKIVVNKYENILQMYVKPEHIRDVFHQGVEQTGKSPYVTVAIGSVDQVEQFLNEAREQGKFSGKFSYDNSKDSEFFSSLLMNICSLAASSSFGYSSCAVWVEELAAAWVEAYSTSASRKPKCTRRAATWASRLRMWPDKLVPSRRCRRL